MQGLDQEPVMDEEKQRLRTISATGLHAELGLHAKLLNMNISLGRESWCMDRDDS